jgi:metal-responsive CopG/Arc/MetJ family transcriptional regulator
MFGSWGGARKGAGRKKLSPAKKKQSVSVYLSKGELDFIDQYDGKNRSEKLRNLIRDVIEKTDQT